MANESKPERVQPVFIRLPEHLRTQVEAIRDAAEQMSGHRPTANEVCLGLVKAALERRTLQGPAAASGSPPSPADTSEGPVVAPDHPAVGHGG